MQAFEFLCCRVVLVALTICVACGPAPTRAQPYPNRPITLIVPLPPGGSNDIMARAVADKLSASLGQQVVVENRAAGGSGTVGTRQAAKSAADGYTLLLGYTSTLATGPSMHRDVGYDPRKDFAPIGLIAAAPSLLLLHPDLKIRSVSELIAMMQRADPPFQVGVPGVGTVNHLASVLFAHQGRSERAADSVQGLECADHRSCGRPCEGRLQSHSGLARGAGIQIDRRARGHLVAPFHGAPRRSDRRRIGIARV